MSADRPLLEAIDLGRQSENSHWLLRNASLRVRAAERLALMGPTGAGKTLLLRALALLDPSDAGHVLWRGEEVAAQDIPRFRASVVYVQQRPALLPGTSRENLQAPFRLHAHAQREYDEGRVIELLARCGQPSTLLDRTTMQHSGGQSQSVALVRAVQLDPHVLLLDEPTSSLDSQATRSVEELLRDWVELEPASRAIVMVTHDARQAQRFGTTVLRLENGQLTREA